MRIGNTEAPRDLLALQQVRQEQHNAAKAPAPRDFGPAAGAQPDRVELSQDAAQRREWPGKAVGIQKMIDEGRAVPAAPNSRVGAAIAQAGEAPPPTASTPFAGPGEGEPSVYGQADLDALMEQWGRRAGDERFQSEFDLNGDGLIDGVDLGLMLGLFGQPKPGDDAPDDEQPPTGGGLTLSPDEAGSKSATGVDAPADAAAPASTPGETGADAVPPTGGGLVEDTAAPTPGNTAAATDEPVFTLEEPLPWIPRDAARAEALSTLRDQLGALLRASQVQTRAIDQNAQSLLELLGRKDASRRV